VQVLAHYLARTRAGIEWEALVGIWNIARSSQSVITMKNVSPDAVTVSAITLYACLNDAVVAISSIPAECQFIKISQSDYKGGNMDLKPGDSIATTILTDTHGLGGPSFSSIPHAGRSLFSSRLQ
jgi:hypothetical protein